MPTPLPLFSSLMHTLPFHYGWLIVAAGSLGIFACIGLARFALGMLLPAMGEDLHLTYAEMGLLSTVNFLGYLAGILATSSLVRLWGAQEFDRSRIAGLRPGHGGHRLRCYPAADYGACHPDRDRQCHGQHSNHGRAVVLVYQPTQGQAAGFVVSGNGAAIILAGLAVPWMNGLTGYGWCFSWVTLGMLVVVIPGVCCLVTRNSPQELGLQPTASRREGQQRSRTNYVNAVYPFVSSCTAVRCILFSVHLCPYATFIVTTMVRQYGFSEQVAGSFWSWVGLFSLAWVLCSACSPTESVAVSV